MNKIFFFWFENTKWDSYGKQKVLNNKHKHGKTY